MDVTLSPGVYVKEVPSGNAPIAGVGTSTAAFVGVVPDAALAGVTGAAAAEEIVLVTNFSEYKAKFGDFPADGTNAGHRMLAHAVFGFLNNGGTRCYVMRVAQFTDIDAELLHKLDPIEEIAIVCAPVPAPDQAAYQTLYGLLKDYCGNPQVQNRFAILDSMEQYATFATDLGDGGGGVPPSSDYAAFYFPWIQVFDPGSKARIFVPPCGHIAGVYARVDTQRGVHKAPANEVIAGALGLRYDVSKAQQDGLNPHGVNCVRRLNGNIRVWGARTVGGDDNLDFKYLSARRLFIFLRGSIDQGLQWAVFEPNNQDLWAKITRNVSAFLEQVWRSGALFGATPQEAFFVKCDAETNPPAVRDAGQVVTEIGVALTRPAEFVVFHIGQKAAET